MGFLSLPPEIIDVILDLSLPSGIQGLSLVCKAIHGRARSQIERHNALKRQWGSANNYRTGKLDDTLGILNAIALNPLVAEYIEYLDLWDERPLDEEETEVLDFRGDVDAMERVKDFVVSLPFLTEAGIDTEAWWNRMMQEEGTRTDEDNTEVSCTTITLLGVLPNLKSIRLDPGWQNFNPGAELYSLPLAGLTSIIERSSHVGASRQRPLSQVKTILPFMHGGYEEKAALQSIQPFLELGAVSEVYLVSAVAVDDGYTGYPFEWRTPTLAPQLTRLELASCCMDAEGISELLRHTPALKTFKYSHETKWHGCEHDWNAGTFVEAVARHCGNTITNLAITIDEIYGEIINGVSSLHSFPNLEFLEVDVYIFRGPPVESGQTQGGDAMVPEGETAWCEDDIPCIGSMMPSNIVEVHINTDFPIPDENALNSLLKNLRSQRQERLFKLERCIIRQYTAESARICAERAGATLETFDLAVENPRARKMMPSWKREFDERVSGLRSRM
ncbi:uncharacterized protein CC84DRAFT_1189420 [Paraphaeosphaeria sporulosa]|uniref:F-box domain-containing protein n=1 Tax=Paraphaeosphaeria sporulosa TaxID=1460663 RepID=A0A177C5P6_9PLEO|nr:uncharacterized protein CC84DRAFT_1189420 [Paraphaeosphaeria sporulosa]OAG02098.1 hypothetical protein CC84DRAFT_1189420 [Paraphaeosphaeria sporulosa]